jgi:ADP-ribosyl-[dinitrogen reductase] hydrolase
MLSHKAKRVEGCLVGCAVGDAIGLPYEGLSPQRISMHLKLPLNHRFIYGFGMISDDTDHTIFVAQALKTAKGNVVNFGRALACRLRLWFLCFPAGIGWATLKGVVKLWIGFGYRNSGVYSAGNGPSMRSAIVGAVYCDDEDSELRQSLVTVASRITHTDPLALAGAHAISEIAARLSSGIWVSRPEIISLIELLRKISPESAWQHEVDLIGFVCNGECTMIDYAEAHGGRMGISGYVLHSIPFAIVCWYKNFGNYRGTIEAVISFGGDVDTNCAIAGALSGISVGMDGIPEEWRRNLVDWPHGIRYMSLLAESLVDSRVSVNTKFSAWLFPRGLLFGLLVLSHGFYRLLRYRSFS